MEKDLDRLPDLFKACEEALVPSNSVVAQEFISVPGTRHRLPVNAVAMEARDTIRRVLASWCGLVADERHLRPPQRTVPAMATFLCRHVDWLAAHPAGGDAAEECAGLVARALRVAQPTHSRKVPIGACTDPTCTGELNAVVRSPERGAKSEIRCTENEQHRWPVEEWLGLGQTQKSARPQGVPWLSAEDIAHIWRLRRGSIYRLASQHHWRRYTHHGRVYYNSDDVSAALS